MPRMNRGVPEKSKDFKGSAKKLIGNLKKYRILIIISIILAFIGSLFSIITPNILKNIVNEITIGLSGTINLNKIKLISLMLLILYLLNSGFTYLEAYLLAKISNSYAYDLRKDISKKINVLPLKYFDNHEVGDILSRITNDVDTITHNLASSITTLVTSFTIFFGSIIMMFVTNYIMAITAIVSSLIGFVLMFIILKKSQKYFTERQQKLGDLNSHIEEVYTNHNIVKTYNGEKLAIEEFKKLNKDLYHSNKMSQFLSGLNPPIMGFVGNLGYVSVCVVGALLASNKIITFGVIVAFMIYVRLFTNPLSRMAQTTTALQSVVAASERVFEFLDEEELSKEKGMKYLDKKKVKGDITFEHVGFGYTEKEIIKDFNATIKAGSKVAIVGPTGAGKTTMVNLLMKFYEINKGDIKIDGVSIKNLTRQNIHDLFIMVLQDTWLFDDTIEENLKFNSETSKSDIEKSCTLVGCDHFIKTLPGGLNALVNDSDTVSSGEKQLLTIARGMIKNSPFLILDEATSSVDTRTEELVQKAMDKLTKGRTSFIIAHRLSTIKNADLILVMDNGNIIEQGTHKSLISKKGFYYELYNSQFETLTKQKK